jgi:hypothetical protein
LDLVAHEEAAARIRGAPYRANGLAMNDTTVVRAGPAELSLGAERLALREG